MHTVIHTALFIAFLGIASLSPPMAAVFAQGNQNPSVQAEFEMLDTKKDQDGIIALWQKHPMETAFVIDTYLEGGLALFEQSGAEKKEEIGAMYDRGLRGALAADKAFGRKIFSDYASSFIGWDNDEKKQFRFGQKSYNEAKDALQKGAYTDAFTLANDSINAARPLGDWWGVAVAQTVSGEAQEGLDNFSGALVSFSEARLLFQNFGMMEDLLRSEMGMARSLVKLKRFPRALVTIESAQSIALQLNKTEVLEDLKALHNIVSK